MSDVVIRVENLAKQYRLGVVGTGTLSHDLNRWWARLRGQDDPTLSVTESNDRAHVGHSEFVWALNDINFEVKQGEVLGIIGRNGAGKSTLLKILSRVTAPTSGQVKVKGRIASLLEVGTGFHPELTGRENIYLNGAIMGMTHREVSSKLDEIVDFSGCERFVDTPVKRYSSGMTVRLGFAVAAHLEPEILVVDEVLAVGDAEFQKKCLGKMKDVAGHGRTVLFVSHNMAAVEKLCQRGVILEQGRTLKDGPVSECVARYLESCDDLPFHRIWETEHPGDAKARLLSVRVCSEDGVSTQRFDIRKPVIVEVMYEDMNPRNCPTAILHFKDQTGQVLFASNEFVSSNWKEVHDSCGIVLARCRVPGNLFAEGTIQILVALGTYQPKQIHALIDEAVAFEVYDPHLGGTVKGEFSGEWPGLLRPWLDWSTERQ